MSSQESRPVGSVAVTVQKGQRGVAWVVMFAAFGFGGWLAFKNYNGIGTASVFAIGLLFAVAAIGGVLPTSIKVGDVQLAIQNAAADGLVKGAEAAQQVAKGAEPEQAAGQVVSETLPSSMHADVAQQVVERLSDVAEARDSTPASPPPPDGQPAAAGPPGPP
jgi:hypothetical protein